MTNLPPTQDQDPTKTLVYTGIAGLCFLLASFLANIVITILWIAGWGLLLFVGASVGWRIFEGKWPDWVFLVCEKLKAIAARWPFGWRP